MGNWIEEAKKYQQSIYDMFGDREFDAVDRYSDDLCKKVICSMYGMPRGDNFDEYFGYTLEQYEKAVAIASCIMDECKYGDKIFVHFIHVVVKLEDSDKFTFVCVFKIPKYNNPHHSNRIFLEVETLRRYDGWSDYVQNNKLPKCEMCYPMNGIYQAKDGRVIVEFKESPACNILPKVVDATGTLASIAGGAAVTASLFFPISTPFVLAGACVAAGGGVISTGRAIHKLVDRGSHGQSVSLGNTNARLLWIDMMLSSIGVVTTGVAAGTAVLSRNAGLLGAIENTFAEALFTGSKAGQFTVAVKNVVRFLECTGLVLNTLGLAACIINMVDKFMSGTLELLDLKVLGLAVFFIANIVICSETARRLIQRFTTSECTPFQMAKHVDFKISKCIQNLCFDSTPLIEVMISGIPKILGLFFDEQSTKNLLVDLSRNVTRLFRGHISFPNFCIYLFPLLKQLVTIVSETMGKLRNTLSENSCNLELSPLNTPMIKIEINNENYCPLVQFSDKEFYLDIFYGIELDESYCMDKVKLILCNELSDRTHYFKLYPGTNTSKAIVLIEDDDEFDAFIFYYSRIEDDNVFIIKAKAPSNINIDLLEDMNVNMADMKKAKLLNGSGSKNTDQLNECYTKLRDLEIKEEKTGITEEKIVQGNNLDGVNEYEGCMLRLENVCSSLDTDLKFVCGQYGIIQMFSMGDSSAIVIYQSRDAAKNACTHLNGFGGILATLVTD